MTETPTPAPLPNDPAARAPDGQILNQSTITPKTPTLASTSSTPPPTETTTNADAQKPGTEPAKPNTKPDAPKVPESYELKTADGKPVDETLLASATPIFKELGLDNTAAQKLVDLYNTNMKSSLEAAGKTIVAQANKWHEEAMAHPTLGPNKDKIEGDIVRGLESAGVSREKINALMKFQSETFVMNNPVLLEPLWELAKRAGPGTHVSGSGPSPHGQSRSGENSRPSIAAALYPNLKSRAS